MVEAVPLETTDVAPDVPKASPTSDYASICKNIAADIESLKGKFPQLADFRESSAIKKPDCRISYEYRCHHATGGGGWTAGVPNPDADGVWFYIGIWDEKDPTESSAQINTQPKVPNWHIGARRVTFLVLEGDKTNKLGGELVAIMKKRGLH